VKGEKNYEQILNRQERQSAEDFRAHCNNRLRRFNTDGGGGLYFLTNRVTMIF
jgi:hypothetical protein